MFTSVIASNLHSSYQRRKQANLGANPNHPPIRSLSAAEVKKKREQWRETQTQHRAAEKRLRAVLDITPESSEEPSEEMLARPHPAVPIPWSDSPPAVIPPTQSPPAVIPRSQSPPAVIPTTQSPLQQQSFHRLVVHEPVSHWPPPPQNKKGKHKDSKTKMLH